MKIALCLYGILGGKAGNDGVGGVIPVSKGGNTYKNTFMDGHEVDTFIHSWSKDSEKEILEYYSPKSYVIETQKDFSHLTIEDYSFKTVSDMNTELGNKYAYDAYKSKMSDDEFIAFYKELIKRTNSRWYSTKKSVDLMNEYRIANNVDYDYVVLIRFDLVLRKKIDFNSLNKEAISLSKRHDRADKEHAYHDLFFIGTPENITKVGEVYDNIFTLPIRPTWAIKTHLDNEKLPTEHILSFPNEYNLVRNT